MFFKSIYPFFLCLLCWISSWKFFMKKFFLSQFLQYFTKWARTIWQRRNKNKIKYKILNGINSVVRLQLWFCFFLYIITIPQAKLFFLTTFLWRMCICAVSSSFFFQSSFIIFLFAEHSLFFSLKALSIKCCCNHLSLYYSQIHLTKKKKGSERETIRL